MEKVNILSIVKKAQSSPISSIVESKKSILNQSHEPPPDKVIANYTTELNIFKIDEAILTRLNYKKSHLNELKDHYNIEKTKKRGKLTINEIRTINAQLDAMLAEIQLIESGSEMKIYQESVKDLLESYKEISTSTSKGIISIKGLVVKKEKEDPDTIIYRLYIIEEYLKIAKKYIDIQIRYTEVEDAKCPACGVLLEESEPDEEQLGLFVCKCGYQTENITSESYYKDSSRVNLANRNNYEDSENFKKVLMRFQGKQPQPPPDELYNQLEEYFIKIGHKTGEEIRSLPINEFGKKEGTSRKLMETALSGTSNSAFYDDIWLIMHVYWGWKLNDVSHLEHKIMEDYNTTQLILISLPINRKSREASLNTQLRLYWHLRAVGYSCSKDDFKLPLSRESLLLQQELWEIMCKGANIQYHPVL